MKIIKIKINKIFIRFLLILLLLLFFSSEKKQNDNFFYGFNILDIIFIPNGFLHIINNNFSIKKIYIELCKTNVEKNNGSKYRFHLKEDSGIFFILENENEYRKINMENVQIPLDIIYIDQNNKIVYINKYISPMRKIKIRDFPKSTKIKYILEVNAGSSNKWNLKEGFSKIYFNY
ncbi:DUF192 domain-containing protein [Blattabacterium cuenoti]|uniref:DUF192 domain-containing protein n=1 Tax=Blattabacterium cuenoti TaxID=1653831 RepID=UPI00163BF316|nr:DUF192 domain-containing protein [Blattabacterium cuenoti]